MNYYPFHLGDYASHTRHLGLLEDLAYRRMLDLYYTSEAALPVDAEKVARLIGMRDYLQEVTDVLSDFFVISDAGHTNSRCEEELALYRAKADRAKSANKARWGGGRASGPIGESEEFEQGGMSKTVPSKRRDLESKTKSALNLQTAQIATNNQEPVSKKQKPVNIQPIKKSKPKAALTPQQCDEYFEDAWEYYPKTPACTRQAAYETWQARIAEGTHPSKLLAGAGCYRSYVDDKQIETWEVMPVAVFWGPEAHYKKDWELRPLWANDEYNCDPEEY